MSADLADTPARYDAANRATLEWLLSRSPVQGVFINTRVNPVSGSDYSAADGLRGPDWICGWIQGRGLEALATFAAHYQMARPDLAARLDALARPLYARLCALRAEHGHGCFLYDKALTPVRRDGKGGVVAQTLTADLFSYSDIFLAKGLIAAAARYAPGDLPQHLAFFHKIRAAIEDGRFQMDEQAEISRAAIAAEPDDHGPRMILLGAAGMLKRAGLAEEAGWAGDMIHHVLDHWVDDTGLLRNVPGMDALNAGHGIEFVGFAFDHIGADGDPALKERLAAVLIRLFDHAFRMPGIPLAVSAASGELLAPWFPWWPLPETIRAAALARASGAPQVADLKRIQTLADTAFFSHYWRGPMGFAYQGRTQDGPADYVPATPDLDPGYHTGLSLLAAQTA
ncbi:MAG: hypothetical protein Q4G25_09485 [Paracoccus sp. (in: a-proteobacteria)]|nr:hypothetical protein [Paracoccus sp. (in: a-proteobacteria)]